MSEAYYLKPPPGARFPAEALDEWRRFLEPQLIVQREDGAYWWFADARAANGFRHSGYAHTEYADLIALDPDVIEVGTSYVHDQPTLAAFREFLARFKERWPYELCGPSKDDMTVDEFVDEYRIVSGP